MLDVKKSLEDRRRLEVAEHEARCRVAWERADTLSARCDKELIRLRALHTQHPFPIAEVERQVALLTALRQEWEAANEAVAAAEEDLRVARGRLTEASVERRIFERLRERHLGDYRMESERQEQYLMDEIGNRTGR